MADWPIGLSTGCFYRTSLENMLPHLLFGRMPDLYWMPAAVKAPNVGICLDTGHASLSLWRAFHKVKEQLPPRSWDGCWGCIGPAEFKTLRRKRARLAGFGRAAEFGRALARQRVAQRGGVMSFLYVDGHARVYHGHHRLPKAHVARMRLSMPATSDYWVNDRAGDPLFVLTAEANAGLVTMLPEILAEIRARVGSRRVNVVLDRGGFSARLFHQILAAGFDLLICRKGRWRRLPARCFRGRRRRHEGRTFT